MGALKVFVASDFHGSGKAFREAAYVIEDVHADVVVVCGDITNFGSIREARDLLSNLVGLRLPIFFVPGNCDPPSLAGVDIEGARCVHGVCEICEDLMFLGVGGGLVSPFRTPFEMTEKEVMSVLNRGFRCTLARRWSVLISHSPPKDTKLDATHAGKHLGSISVRRFIEDKRPDIVFCGHVHEARGTDQIGDTLLVNPGSARHGYYALADFNEKIQVKLDLLY